MSAIALLGLARRFGPYILAALAIVGAYFWAYNRGADHVQGEWDKAKARGVLIIAAKNAELQTAKDAAITAGIERDRIYQLAKRPITNEVTAYVKTPGAANRCPDDGGVQIGQRAIDAANAATAAR
jgi:hypothetical protein